MGLFDKFDNIYDTNISASQVSNMKVGTIPYEQYNAEGKLIGYYWHYGDTIDLHFIIDGEVNLDVRRYNEDDNSTVTVEKKYISAEDYLKDKNARITFHNFRYDPILQKEIPIATNYTTLNSSVDIRLLIDDETSKKLLRGTYYLTLTIFKENENMYQEIIKDKDCLITIK